MLVHEIVLRQLRLFKELQLVFSPKVNVLVGPNAIGKTTVLEAIYLLISGQSFRTNHLKELVKSGFEKFFVEARYQKSGVEQSIRLLAGNEERSVFRLHQQRESWSSLVGLLLGTVLTPADVELVQGCPQIRRRYLDLQICQTDPLYMHHLVRYQKAMVQRNVLLKKRKLEAISIWEKQMAVAGAYLTHKRSQAVTHLSKILTPLHFDLSDGREKISIHYLSKLMAESGARPLQEAFESVLSKNRQKEAEVGHTLYGPHKDDLEIQLNEMPARLYGSEGQQRSAAASLKFAEWELLKRESSKDPIMLIDDFALSYDQARKEKLLSHIHCLGQVFITTSQENLTGEHSLKITLS